MRLLALTLLLATPAYAQSTCGVAVGGMVGVSPAGRDWDLTTPGPYAVSPSPAVSMRCTRRPTGAWIGASTTPLLRHSYEKLDGRGPLPVSASAGWQMTGPYATIGPFFTTNGAAHGGGLRIERPLLEPWLTSDGWLHPTLDLRVARIGGRDAQYQGWVMIELTSRAPGEGRGWGPRSAELDLYQGFEVGTVTGYRLSLIESPALDGKGWPVALGLRAGVLTDLPRGRALEPIALATVDVGTLGNNALSLGAGGVLRDDEVHPVVGLSRRNGVDGLMSLNTGVLAGADDGELWLALDVGLSMMW